MIDILGLQMLSEEERDQVGPMGANLTSSVTHEVCGCWTASQAC
jgi:hypothetical protein